MGKKKPELLAPAGGIKQLVAAVENGADAVYLGGPLFNARINADNFSEDNIKEAIDYAHLRNVKIYIALNVLLKDYELLPALQYAVRLYNMGADALILQDLGFADLVREYLPEFPIHLSTQGSIYNVSGVKKAQDLGFSRVVLARELSIGEIQDICQNETCDIEVFVHGALCMCYSGQCQMSRALGGGERSGNRGLCAQPCRLPYLNDQGKSSFALSPKDLCTVDHLGELVESGASSLKIEGRMKSAEYVAAVVGLYRKYLDLYCSQGYYSVSPEDRELLLQIFNRGGFTEGYLLGNPGERLMSDRLPKHQGVYMGTVVNPSAGRDLIDVKLEKPLELGDGVEIRGRNIAGNVVTYKKELKSGLTRIGDIKDSVESGSKLYRITSSLLMKQLRKTYEEGGPQGVKHRKKVPISMTLKAQIGKAAVLTVEENGLHVTVSDTTAIAEQAVNRPLSEAAVEKQLKKTGGTPFQVVNTTIELEAGCSLPLSAINGIRREALQAISEKKLRGKRAKMIPSNITLKAPDMEKRLAFYFYEGKSFAKWDFDRILDDLDLDNARAYVPLGFFMDKQPEAGNIEVVPYVLNISKGKLDRYIEKNFEQIVDRTKSCGIALGNLGWIEAFSSRGVPIYADYGLNLYNSKALETAVKQNMVPTVFSHEKDDAICGQIPLMITEHLFHVETLVDRKKQPFKIVYNYEKDKNMLFRIEKDDSVGTLKNVWKNATSEVRVYIT